MNSNQKKVLIAVIVIVLCMLFYPPFMIYFPNGAQGFLTYSYIFNPPGYNYNVEISLLLTQWLGVIIVGGIAFFLLKSGK